MKNNTFYYSKQLPLKNQTDNKLTELYMNKLPLGDVTVSQGWLRTQLDLMCEGITGKLPEFGPYFKPDKNGFLYPETASGWEEIPYWFRGFYPMAVLADNKEHLATAQKYFEALFASRQEDGWFGPAYLKEYDILPNGMKMPDLFPSMMLLDALILYYENTKDERVMETMDAFFKFCANIPDPIFLPARRDRLRWQKVRGGDMLTPIYWYYRQTGQDWLLDLAEKFHQKIWKCDMEFIAHHAVDFGQRVGYDAVYSQQSNCVEDFQKSEDAYLLFKEVWGQMPRGIFAADEQIREGETDPRQGYEPCGIVELTKNFYEMGRISGNTVYGDRTEDIMLNHFAPSFSPSYQQMHYITCANLPILSDWRQQPTTDGSWVLHRSHEIFTPNNRCCGHNTGMGWPWYAMNLWQRSTDGGIVAWLYSDSELNTTLGDKKIALAMRTNYPFDTTITVKVTECEITDELPMYFRIPAWSESVKVTLGGKTADLVADKEGFVCVKAIFEKGDEIKLAFGASLSMTKWKNNGSVSVDLGPLTYSVKIPECWREKDVEGSYAHPDPHLFENYEVLPKTHWNYGLCLEGDDISSCVSIKEIKTELAAQPFTVEDAPIVLKARARRIPEWSLEDDMCGKLQPSPAYTDFEEEEIEMIPLGCARLRISCLPTVTTDAEAGVHWKRTPVHVPIDERTHRYPDPYIGGAPKGAIPD